MENPLLTLYKAKYGKPLKITPREIDYLILNNKEGYKVFLKEVTDAYLKQKEEHLRAINTT